MQACRDSSRNGSWGNLGIHILTIIIHESNLLSSIIIAIRSTFEMRIR